MSQYRDPKVTPADKGGNAGKWIGIVIVILIALALIAWAMDWLGTDETEAEPAPTPIEETQVPEQQDPVVEQRPALAPSPPSGLRQVG